MNTPIQFQLQFATLLRVHLTHEYYRDGAIAGLRLMPDAATRHWLRNHQMVFKPQGNGFTIGAKAGVIEDLRPDPRAVLRFEAYTTDPYLDSVTAGAFRKPHEIYYHSADSRDFGGFDRIGVQAPHFILKISEENSNKPLSIKDKSNTTVWEGTPTGESLQVQLDIDTTGYHAVYDGDGKLLTAFYVMPKRPVGWFASIEIPVAALLAPDWEVHTLSLASRAVQWRYWLVPYHATADLEQITITAQQRHAPYQWEAPQRTTIHTGQSAIMLASSQPIPLHALPQWRFALKALKTDTQEHIQIQLPTPQLKHLAASPDDPDMLCADLYVRY